MIQELAGYGAVILAAVASVWFGGKQSNNAQLTTAYSKITSLEGEKQKLAEDNARKDKEIQMFRRRELWRERREGILIDRLNDEALEVPVLPEAPEAWSV